MGLFVGVIMILIGIGLLAGLAICVFGKVGIFKE